MARRTLPLNELSIKKAIRTAKTENKTVKSFDGGGLFLLVDKSGNTGWRFKYRFSNKEKLISFGVYPAISLSDARKQRSAARELIAKGTDPSLSRKL
ncbi:MAG: Arm DNA-binding domain-containing protein, partial [Geopsychrobacter sp.]|nr:Arm DNA-binding domain-containing protein [Geopsychrobacter sp.]